jgi:LmbE family N-acetylglucosaminyl deacetylase
MSFDRRRFLISSAASVGLSAWGLSPASAMAGHVPDRKLRVVCVGGHPDDPESGCGGTLARLANEGHEVTIIYLTSGEAGISGKSHAEAASIRTAEARAAARVLGAKPVFAGQVDGSGEVNNEWVNRVHDLITRERPDIVFTHWPVDTHKDHQCASLLTIQSWKRSTPRYDLYFFEVCAGDQTLVFRPTDYVDISSTQEQKKKAVYCHASQDPPGIYAADDCNHAMMEKFRGIEANVPAAEAFIRAGQMLRWG